MLQKICWLDKALGLTYYDENSDYSPEELNKNSCYVYDSLPYVYYKFLSKPTLEGLFDVVNEGGDADTNASMFASLLGALHGIEIFPDRLINDLLGKDHLEKTFSKFFDTTFDLICSEVVAGN